MRPDGDPPRKGEAGFALLEVLAAVAVAGFVLSAIGSVVAVTFVGLRSTTDRVALAETARALLDGLPQADDLRPGTTTGTLGTTRWRIDVAPIDRSADSPSLPDGRPPVWTTATIVIAARTRSGRSLRLDTVGLIRNVNR